MPGTMATNVTSPASRAEWYVVSVNRTIATLTIDCPIRAICMPATMRGSAGAQIAQVGSTNERPTATR